MWYAHGKYQINNRWTEIIPKHVFRSRCDQIPAEEKGNCNYAKCVNTGPVK